MLIESQPAQMENHATIVMVKNKMIETAIHSFCFARGIEGIVVGSKAPKNYASSLGVAGKRKTLSKNFFTLFCGEYGITEEMVKNFGSGKLDDVTDSFLQLIFFLKHSQS
jgi:hypothetical protein